MNIKNVRLVLQNAVTEPTDLRIENGVIAEYGKALDADAARCAIDGGGGYLFPGFVDVHVHGGGGADFMDATPDAFTEAISAHLVHGTTTLVPTAMSASYEDLLAFLRAYRAFKETSALSSCTSGVHLEGPYFSNATDKSKGAQKADVLRPIDLCEVDALLDAADGDIIRWDAAPELEKADAFAKKLTEKGVVVAVAHSRATAEETAAGYAAGFSHATHFYNACTAYEKRGQVVTAGTVEATYLNEDVTLELIADGKHVPRACLLLALKVKGEDKVIAITDAMRLAATDLKEGRLGSLKNGTDVIVEDGVAKLPDRSSFAGSIATADRALRVLCVDYGVSPVTAAKMLSTNPARLIGRDDIGAIAVGCKADLVLTDADLRVLTVFKDGKPV